LEFGRLDQFRKITEVKFRFSFRVISLFWPRKEFMPITYNGIGTHYYGKSNLEIRPGQCRSCNRHVQLQSYDTRLWFVIVFIPIIPLGRKRILDSCPSCRRHYVSDLHKWETARQLEVSGAMDKFQSSPTPENAIAVHQQMLGFHQVTEATQFEKTMLAQFPDSAKIYAYLGSAQDHIGRRDQAAESYKRALELRPDLPEARIGMARAHIREGRLDDARKLLDFLEKPGSAQLYSLEVLETLAYAYQNRSQHREALELFGRLLEEFPKLGEHPGFRKKVKESEKALKPERSILPKLGFSLKRILETSGRGGRPIASVRGLLMLGAVVALVILGFGISNEYIRHHRKIYLINGYDTPATVSIADAGEVKSFKGVRELVLPEGRFHAVISGPVQEEVNFEVRDEYFNRWFGDAQWVINVGGGALLQLTTATYSQNAGPVDISFRVGQTFEHFPNVTHVFKKLPESVPVSSGGSRTLVELEVFSGDATDVFAYLDKKKGVSAAFDLGEMWLRAHPDDEVMLATYASAAKSGKQMPRFDVFLSSGLTNRPVRIAWHRTYQNLRDRSSAHADLLNQYDELLRHEPTNSALLYLRGRIESDRPIARDYFTRSADADPRNPFPSYALGYDRMAAGDWKGAKPFLVHAAELNSHIFGNLLFVIRTALNEGPELEQEVRKKLARDPMDYVTQLELIDALAAEEKPDQALIAANKFIALCKSRYGASEDKLASAVNYHTYYAVGDFDKLKSASAKDTSPGGRMVQALALIEQGQPNEAAKVLPPEMDSDDEELLCLGLAITYHQSGDEASATRWRLRAVGVLERGNTDERQAALLLSRGAAPSRTDVEDVAVMPLLKSAIVTELAFEYPSSRPELMEFARQLNVQRDFPHYLIQRIAGKGPQ